MELGRRAFDLDGQAVTDGEVLAAAFLAGTLAPVLQRVDDGLVAESLAAEQAIEIDSEVLQDAFDEWRIERDLIAAQELEDWLADRGLDLDELQEHVERTLLRSRCGARIAGCRDRFAPSREQVLSGAAREASFSGDLGELIDEQALRLLAPAASGGERAAANESLLAEAGLADATAWAETAARFGVTGVRAAWLLEREADFRVHRRELLSAETLEKALARQRNDLVRFDVVSANLPTEDAAREVLCCIRIDRDGFKRAAARAGVPCRSQTLFPNDLEDVPYGNRLASVRRLELFGPLEVDDDHHVVAQLLERHEPELDVPDVRKRLERRVLDRALRPALAERVRFALESDSWSEDD